MATILIVDDRTTNREFLVSLLGYAGHHLLEASDGDEALSLSQREHPDLIITDILMPSMDGFSFVRSLRRTPGIEQTAVIFWTATYLEHEANQLARACGVNRVLGKPCEPEQVLQAVDATLRSAALDNPRIVLPEIDRRHVRLITNKLAQKMRELEEANGHLEELLDDVRSANENLVRAYDETLEGWVRALDLRDQETEGHTQRVTELSIRLAQSMGISGNKLIALRRGALLHDIGKLGIPDNILHKPGPLTEEEWKLMRLHPVHARRMLEPIDYLKASLEIPYCHHEKWDGTGYPEGLQREQIPLSARLFAVVDVWDALRSKRPYHEAWTERDAINYITSQAGKHFDPRVVDYFLSLEQKLVAGKKRELFQLQQPSCSG